MKVQTTRFGEINVPRKMVVHFAEGLLGFESQKRFTIISQGEDSPFKWLQSLDDPDLAFIIIQPIHFRYEYNLEIDDEDARELGLSDEKEVLIYAIVTVPSEVRKMTANLQGPLVINGVNNQGKQVIFANPNYHTRHEILTEMEERARLISKMSPSDKTPQKPAKKGGKSC